MDVLIGGFKKRMKVHFVISPAGSLPCRLYENSVLTIKKDAVWHPYGECCGCNDLGPCHFHCKQCALSGLLFVSEAYPYM
jgi:hypothetical protein